jgi:hypothetical protein
LTRHIRTPSSIIASTMKEDRIGVSSTSDLLKNSGLITTPLSMLKSQTISEIILFVAPIKTFDLDKNIHVGILRGIATGTGTENAEINNRGLGYEEVFELFGKKMVMRRDHRGTSGRQR